MEALYTKLYDKYTKLKAKKANEKDQINYDQEEKFINYVSVVDDLIAHLTSEKDRLSAEISELRQQVITIRSAKDEEQEKYERMLIEEKRMLIEENQKNKELSEEIERLLKNESLSTTCDDTTGSPLSSGRTNSSTKRKRRRVSLHDPEVEVALGVGGQHDQNNHTSPPHGSENALEKENMFSVAFNNANQPKCCRQRLGDSASASDPTICMFQELVEYLLNLKFSIATESGDNILITALHESSGYSFNLGWVKNESGDEELMYRVSSLGTFERVAPEWMRDVIVFRKSMCHDFFKRVSAIVKRKSAIV